MASLWDILNKIAIIGTVIGIPLTLAGIFNLIYGGVIVYDMYRELNDAGGYTVVIGSFSRRDCKRGKREDPQRQYHKKGLDFETDKNWI